MEFEDLSKRKRLGAALVVFAVLTVAVWQAVAMASITDKLLLLVPGLFVFLGGITWDRIYVHDQTI